MELDIPLKWNLAYQGLMNTQETWMKYIEDIFFSP